MRVGRETRGLHAEIVGVGLTADGEKHVTALDARRARRAVDTNANAGRRGSDVDARCAQTERDAFALLALDDGGAASRPGEADREETDRLGRCR